MLPRLTYQVVVCANYARLYQARLSSRVLLMLPKFSPRLEPHRKFFDPDRGPDSEETVVQRGDSNAFHKNPMSALKFQFMPFL